MKAELKQQAIELRKQGRTYSEIMEVIPVAISTVSDWLHSVGLSKKQKQRITLKKLASIKKGGLARKNQRLSITKEIFSAAKKDIKSISQGELWFIGIVLYWAEGSKQRETTVSQGVVFSNSDPRMIKIFLKWLKDCAKVSNENIKLEITIHENYKKRVNKVIQYWSQITGVFKGKFDKIYYKKHNIKSLRKNQGDNYYGQLRIVVRKSTNLNRKIAGWIEGICQKCGVV